MDLFKNIGNFFNGIFNGDKNDEEKKRREREAAKRAAQIKVQRTPKQNQAIKEVFTKPDRKITLGTPKAIPKPAPAQQSLNDFMAKPRVAAPTSVVQAPAKPAVLPKKPSYSDEEAKALKSSFQKGTVSKQDYVKYTRERADRASKAMTNGRVGLGEVAGGIWETFFAEDAKKLSEQNKVSEALREQGYIPGMAPIGAKQKAQYEKDLKEAERKTGIKRDEAGGIASTVNVAANLAGAGELVNLGKAGVRSVGKVIADLEEKLGRKLSKQETADITKKVEADAVQQVDEIKPTKDKPVEAEPAQVTKATEAPEIQQPRYKREEVAESYKNVFNRINGDPNLTPEQKAQFALETRKRHAEMLKQIDETEAANTQLLEEAAKKQADEQAALSKQVEELQAEPTPPAVDAPQGVDKPVTDTGVNDQAYRAMQDERKAERTQNPVMQFLKSIRREVVDPRAVQQKLDNVEMKRLKAEGLIPKGQKELAGNQSLAMLRGRIENPARASEVRDREKYGNWSLNDIIKFYGKEDGDKARSFENYRLYKDELERLFRGGKNSIGVDPKEMARYVKDYERVNPLAVEHNASLREMSLDQLRAKNQARIDDPNLLKAAEEFEFYNPRQALDPEDLIRPQMTGGIRSGAKGTQLRSETAGGEVRSPLSLFKQRGVETERALAQQDYDMLIRDMAKRGEKGFTEVVDADVAIAHKQALTTMRELSEQLKGLKTVAKGAKKDLKNAKIADQAKQDAVAITRKYLADQANSPSAQAIHDKMPDKELLELFGILGDTGEVATKRIAARIAKDTGETPEQVKDFITGVRAAMKDTKTGRTEAFNEMVATTQNLERGTQTITYKLDGETGKVEIPADLAEELAKANEALNVSPIEQTLQGVANVQKLTWTGALSPVFKTFNVLVKNPLLAYRNADGLSGVRPGAVYGGLRAVFNTPKIAAFKKEIIQRGASYENALQTRNINSTTADDIAARANLISFFNRSPVHTLQDLWKGLSTGLAHFDNAQRTQVAYGAYIRARKAGIPEQQALDIAAQAPAKVFGDFDRISRLARNAEIILPYSGAIQAGARSLGRASKIKPVQTAVKDATFLAAAGGMTAYSLSNNADYYQDMIDAGREYELDNNWTVVLPGASRDEKGNWSGVVKIPLTPDLRPYNRATWRSVYDVATDGNEDIGMIAGEIFNQFTGDMANSIYDQSKTDDGANPLNGLLSGSPAGTAIKIAAGVNPRDGTPLADEFTSRLPRTEQANEYTSGNAKAVSSFLGGVVTPLQVDAVLDQLGNTGDLLQNREDANGETDPLGKFFNFAKPLAPGKGTSDKGKDAKVYYEDLDAVKRTITDEKTFKEFEALHSKKTDDQKKNLLTSATKAAQFMNYSGDGAFTTTPLFEAERKLDELARARGEKGNPIFDLPPQALQKVLTYRSGKIYNAAKQNYTKSGEGAFQSLGLDNKWYSDFQKAESDYYKEIFKDGDSAKQKTFSGYDKPKLSEEQQAMEDAYYALPEKSAERKAFLSANPWLKEHWALGNDFTAAERKALGFNEVVDEYGGKGGFGYGSGGDGSSTYNALNEILNEGDSLKRLESLIGTTDAKVVLDLQRLFAPRRGGRASVTIGGRASGR